MGNHEVGRGMGSAARMFWSLMAPDGSAERDEPPSREKVLEALDIIASPWRGSDAEFDDEAFPDEPLGRMIAIAFGPWTPEQDASDEQWDVGPYAAFRERYEFC